MKVRQGTGTHFKVHVQIMHPVEKEPHGLYCLVPTLGCLSQVTRYCHKCRVSQCHHILSIQGTVLQMFPSHSERGSELVTAESRVYTASTMQHMLDLPELLPNRHRNSWGYPGGIWHTSQMQCYSYSHALVPFCFSNQGFSV